VLKGRFVRIGLLTRAFLRSWQPAIAGCRLGSSAQHFVFAKLQPARPIRSCRIAKARFKMVLQNPARSRYLSEKPGPGATSRALSARKQG